MKKLSLIILSLIFPFLLISQEKTKQKEVGLLFSSMNQFGITFKTGTNKSLWRFNTLYLSGYNKNEVEDSSDNKSNNYGFNVQVGHEFRTNINDKLEFRYGADISFHFYQFERDVDDKTVDDRDFYSKRTIYEPGINIVIGFNYIINDKLVFGAELLPSISYGIGEEKEEKYYNDYSTVTDISGLSYGFSTSSARLSLVYRF